jgi:hypothetical protein
MKNSKFSSSLKLPEQYFIIIFIFYIQELCPSTYYNFISIFALICEHLLFPNICLCRRPGSIFSKRCVRFRLYWKSLDLGKFTVSAGTSVELAVGIVIFPEFIQANVGVVREVGHGHFLLNPSYLLFTYPSTIRRCIV